VVAVADGEIDTPVDAIRIGAIGGNVIDFGEAGSIPLEHASEIWRNALPRRMN
jgi:uncharacterized protein with ATP-grasp and redox domains